MDKVYSTFEEIPLDDMHQTLFSLKEQGKLHFDMVSLGIYTFMDKETREVYLVDEEMAREFLK